MIRFSSEKIVKEMRCNEEESMILDLFNRIHACFLGFKLLYTGNRNSNLVKVLKRNSDLTKKRT